MEHLVRLIAPRGRLDFVVKVLILLLALGAMNWLRDMVEHGVEADRYFNNLWEAAVVGILPTILALLLIGHLDRLQRKLARMALTDPLTGLPNRRAFFDKVADLPDDTPSVLMMIDADHFKAVNDGYGHGVGDACLIQMAQMMKDQVRATDLVARLGGEEFAILLVGANELRARAVGDVLTAGVTLDHLNLADPPTVTMSAGAVVLRQTRDFTRLMARADAALYRAKVAGRACLVFDTPPDLPRPVADRWPESRVAKLSSGT